MGFTVEDMLLISKRRYRMKLIAGKKGWSNSISWLMMVEDLTIVQRFTGKELAVTTGLGFQKEEQLHRLMAGLVRQQAAGLIINTGCYIMDIPDGIRKFADDNSFPLLAVPWDVEIAEMIKDLSIRIFLQGSTDEQISAAFIKAIETPDNYDSYSKTLLPHFDLDGPFQVMIMGREGLAEMDTVERRRLGYRLQLALTNLTHNGHFFYYDSCFVVIMNAVKEPVGRAIIEEFRKNIQIRLPDQRFALGVGSRMNGILSLHDSYERARAAARLGMKMTAAGAGSTKIAAPSSALADLSASGMPESMAAGLGENPPILYFDDMGILRLLTMVSDRQLLSDFEKEYLGKLEDYDSAHDTEYVETLENYLKYSGSVRKVAEVMFIHRNTISYRMNHIRGILDAPLDTEEEKLCYLTACLIRKISG